MVALDSQQRPDAREQLGVVERLGDEVIGARLDGARALRPEARREHDHGENGRLLARAESATDLVAVGLRHEDVEEDEIGLRRHGELERDVAVRRSDDVVALGHEHGPEQAHILGDVVDDEDPAAVLPAHPTTRSQYRRTVATSLTMSTGFET